MLDTCDAYEERRQRLAEEGLEMCPCGGVLFYIDGEPKCGDCGCRNLDEDRGQPYIREVDVRDEPGLETRKERKRRKNKKYKK